MYVNIQLMIYIHNDGFNYHLILFILPVMIPSTVAFWARVETKKSAVHAFTNPLVNIQGTLENHHVSCVNQPKKTINGHFQ